MGDPFAFQNELEEGRKKRSPFRAERIFLQ